MFDEILTRVAIKNHISKKAVVESETMFEEVLDRVACETCNEIW